MTPHRADDTETDAEIYDRISAVREGERRTLEQVMKLGEKWGKRLILAVAVSGALVIVAAWAGFKYTPDRTLITREEKARARADTLVHLRIDSLIARIAVNELARLAMVAEMADMKRRQEDTIGLLCNLQINPQALRICAAQGAVR